MSRLVMPRPAFFMHMPDSFFHYHAVLELLEPDSFEVIIPDDAPQALKDLLENSAYSVSYVSALLSSRTMYKYLISDHIFLEDYHLFSELGTRQVRFFCESVCAQPAGEPPDQQRILPRSCPRATFSPSPNGIKSIANPSGRKLKSLNRARKMQ